MAKYKVTKSFNVLGGKTVTTTCAPFDIGDPRIGFFWVTELNIKTDPDVEGGLKGTVRYENSGSDLSCTLKPRGTEGDFDVAVGSDGRVRSWRLCPRLLQLIVKSEDNGYMLTGAIQVRDPKKADKDQPGCDDFIAEKYTPPIGLVISTSDPLDQTEWKPCKSGPGKAGADVSGYWYKFVGGDDNQGGLIVGKNVASVVEINMFVSAGSAPDDYQFSKIKVGDQAEQNLVKESDGKYYVRHGVPTGQTEVTRSEYSILVTGPKQLKLWCDPVILDKAGNNYVAK